MRIRKREYETNENNETSEKMFDFFVCSVIFVCFVLSLPLHLLCAESAEYIIMPMMNRSASESCGA
jgi:hypothetical protein